MLIAAHLGSVWLQIAADHTAQLEFEQIASLVLGFAILVPGLLCVSLAGQLARGELHAQKRTLAAAIVVLGLTLPQLPFRFWRPHGAARDVEYRYSPGEPHRPGA